MFQCASFTKWPITGTFTLGTHTGQGYVAQLDNHQSPKLCVLHKPRLI